MIYKKLIFLTFLITFPLKSLALIEVDITRGNLNPLPIAVSSLASNNVDKENLKKELDIKDFFNYMFFQIISGLLAVLCIHYIFQIDLFQVSTNVRGEIPLLVSEIIATSGLIMTILFIRESDETSVAIGVALFITAGYWFTSSTSFANPAVTIARMFTNTFTGIAPVSFIYFIFGQLIGSFIGLKIFKLIKE